MASDAFFIVMDVDNHIYDVLEVTIDLFCCHRFSVFSLLYFQSKVSLPRLLAGGEAAWREFVPAEDGDFSVLWEKDVCRGVKMGTAMCSGKRKTLQCPCEPDSEAFFIPKESGGWPLLAKRPRRNPQSPAGVAVMPFTCRT